MNEQHKGGWRDRPGREPWQRSGFVAPELLADPKRLEIVLRGFAPEDADHATVEVTSAVYGPPGEAGISVDVTGVAVRRGGSLEQQARDLLERAGVPDAQSMTAGDLVEIANLLGDQMQLARQAIAICDHHDSWIATKIRTELGIAEDDE